MLKRLDIVKDQDIVMLTEVRVGQRVENHVFCEIHLRQVYPEQAPQFCLIKEGFMIGALGPLEDKIEEARALVRK